MVQEISIPEMKAKADRLDACIKGLTVLRDSASGRMQAINKQMDELKAEYNAIERTRSDIVDLLADLTKPEPKPEELTTSNRIARTPEKG
jgi:t-SNARE complex subunit (syntaxin)